jgi:peptidyl-tRNA hydrolase, PTH1 family
MQFFRFFRNFFSTGCTCLKDTDFVVFGLGNPGEKYAHTRHNIGFRVVDRFSSSLTAPFKISTPNAEVVKGTLAPSYVVAAVKPTTFMNRSGVAVAEILKKCDYSVKKQIFIIVVDDIHIPFGTFRIRGKGTHGGHNGLRSVIEEVGTGFIRLRVGIGPFVGKTGMIDFVLGNFTGEEEDRLPGIIKKGSEILHRCVSEPIDVIMNTFN